MQGGRTESIGSSNSSLCNAAVQSVLPVNTHKKPYAYGQSNDYLKCPHDSATPATAPHNCYRNGFQAKCTGHEGCSKPRPTRAPSVSEPPEKRSTDKTADHV